MSTIQPPAQTSGPIRIVGEGSTGPVSGLTTRATGVSGSTGRSLADRAADQITVKDFGARLDGADDTAAYNAARAILPPDGTVSVPPGRFVVNATPSSGPTSSVLWRLSGNKYGSSTVPVVGIGTDTVETVLEGGRYFGRTSSRPLASPVVRMDSKLDIPSPNPDTSGAQPVMSTLKVNMDIPSHPSELGYFGWAQSTTIRSSAWGTGQHVAVAAQAVRPSDALSDGRGPRAVIWANYGEVSDDTGQSVNAAGSLVIGEFDMYANGVSYVEGQAARIGHHLVFSRRFANGERMRANYGIYLSTNDIYASPPIPVTDHSFLGVGYGLDIGYDVAAFDASRGRSINNAPAFKLGETQRIAFDGSIAGYNRSLYYDSGVLTYKTQIGPAFQSVDNGDFIVFGILKAQAFNAPDQSAPTGTNDSLGAVGDVRFNGQYIYRKTTSGWYRSAQFTTF